MPQSISIQNVESPRYRAPRPGTYVKDGIAYWCAIVVGPDGRDVFTFDTGEMFSTIEEAWQAVYPSLMARGIVPAPDAQNGDNSESQPPRVTEDNCESANIDPSHRRCFERRASQFGE